MSVLINEILHSHRLKWRWPLSRQVTLSIGTLAVLLTVWWAVAALQLISPLFLPPPQQVLAKLLTIAGPQGFMDATLWQHLAASLTRILLALLAAVLIGIPVGIAMGLSPTVRGILDPIIELYRPVPPLAYLPLMVIWFGKKRADVLFRPLLYLLFNEINDNVRIRIHLHHRILLRSHHNHSRILLHSSFLPFPEFLH